MTMVSRVRPSPTSEVNMLKFWRAGLDGLLPEVEIDRCVLRASNLWRQHQLLLYHNEPD